MPQLQSRSKKEKTVTKISSDLSSAREIANILGITVNEAMELKFLMTHESIDKNKLAIEEQDELDRLNLQDVRDMVTEWKELFYDRDRHSQQYATHVEELILLELQTYWGDEATISCDRESWTVMCSAPCKETITIKG